MRPLLSYSLITLGKRIWKVSRLVKSEILAVFVNTLTANHKCPVRDCENLLLSILTILSEKRESFCQFLCHFWNFQQILNIYEIKKVVIANVIPKLQTVKDLVRPLSKKRRFKIFF